VAKVNPRTLKPIWHRQLANTARSGAWDYPGTLALMDDGLLYVIYGHHLAKLNPRNGRVRGKVGLPIGGASGLDTAYNGFGATSDGSSSPSPSTAGEAAPSPDLRRCSSVPTALTYRARCSRPSIPRR